MKLLSEKLGLAVTIAFFSFVYASAQNDSSEARRQYTEKYPLVYLDTWDLPPYVFLNERGEPDGYTVEVLKMMLRELKIPYVIKLKPTLEAQEEFSKGKADLHVGSVLLPQKFYKSKNIIVHYTFSVAYPKTMNINISSLEDLKRYQFYVRSGSRYYEIVKREGLENNAININDMSDAIKKISADQKGLILWNSPSIKWTLKKFKIENIQVDEIKFPQVGYRIYSQDSVLISKLDSVYSVLNLAERLGPIQAKWFFPERVQPDSRMPLWVWLAMILAASIALMMAVYSFIYHREEKKAIALTKQRRSRLSLILQVSEVRIWTFDVAKRIYTWYDVAGNPQYHFTPAEVASRCHPSMFDKIEECIGKIVKQEGKEYSFEAREKNVLDPTDPTDHDYVVDISVLRWKNDKPSVIIGVKSDLTEERNKQRYSRRMLARYQAIFNTSMVDMMLYDKDGRMIEMNDRAQKNFHATPEKLNSQGLTLKNLLGIEVDTLSQLDYYYATILQNSTDEKTKYNKDDFYELQLVPMRDKGNQLEYILGTGRNVSEVAKSYGNILEGVKQLKKAHENITNYIENINYVMKNGGVRLLTYSPDTHMLSLYGQADQVQLELTQTRCLYFVSEAYKQKAMRILNSMDDRTDRPFEADLQTTIKYGQREQLHLLFHFVPRYDENGKLLNYFGMCRDVSSIKAAEHRLQLETTRAQDIENLKNNFLRNMSYEIRTPLNTIMGFAELLDMEHTNEEEEIFVKEMKENSSQLLSLINEILFLSRLDAHMIEIKPQPSDFALTFEAYCYQGWGGNEPAGVHFVVHNPYEHLVVNIDDANVGRIIEQVVANAAQHTTSGSVSARYEYVSDKLIITIEDTGCGMNKETLSRIYKRFASSKPNGSGLGMPICQELASQMGGSIDVNSEEGKGTTVWITIPCEATTIGRKIV